METNSLFSLIISWSVVNNSSYCIQWMTIFSCFIQEVYETNPIEPICVMAPVQPQQNVWVGFDWVQNPVLDAFILCIEKINKKTRLHVTTVSDHNVFPSTTFCSLFPQRSGSAQGQFNRQIYSRVKNVYVLILFSFMFTWNDFGLMPEELCKTRDGKNWTPLFLQSNLSVLSVPTGGQH